MDCSEDSNALTKDILDVIQLSWGSDVVEDVYQRWNQGLIFGTDESTALLQFNGGPCAVIVPLQAYLLKNLLFSSPSPVENWRQITGCERDNVLCEALADILWQVVDPTSHQLKLCYLSSDTVSESSSDSLQASASNVKRQRLSHEEFHKALRSVVSNLNYNNGYLKCSKILNTRNELVVYLRSQLSSFSEQYGLLLFLYSVLLTKGCSQIKKEMADTFEPLIDSVHGHGSQSLINLLLTGTATSHVWDNEKNVSGLKLQGISSRSDIGFLTLLEHLRYCEVGWNLKNPHYPIWLIGSETHLTLLFSQDRSLVGDEGQETGLRRMFSRFDEDGRGFISADSLGDLMAMLDLVSEPEYVKLMADKLDPEQLGVITFNSFVEEFFPGALATSRDHAVQSFTVFHYNGLQRSPSNKVVYVEGRCTISDMPELQMMSDYSPIKTCLLTKWPTIELAWNDGATPSIV